MVPVFEYFSQYFKIYILVATSIIIFSHLPTIRFDNFSRGEVYYKRCIMPTKIYFTDKDIYLMNKNIADVFEKNGK